ncbi:head maturation protease, ClpP-related [Anaeroselena agilis]|uniref:Clp protease ClpP n=1 Tax=Anaeroselena agilis TaxID=3063788 RepID=A0ABU3NYH3_9FIRM|nr:Clp protease ClpP [Selenomonadales bacterium 4137-cl]
MSKFWSFIKNAAKPDEVELRIDGDIVDDDLVWIYEWFGMQAAAPNAFREELSQYVGQNITVWIDSYGGSVFAATGICNALLNHKETGATVTTIGDGKVMSAAVTIFLSGDKRKASPGCMFMTHNPLTYASGYASDLRKAADVLDVVKETIVNVYQMATGLSRNKISAMMDAETYMDANTAIKNRIATEMLYASKAGQGNSSESVMNFAFSRLDIQNAANDSMRKFYEVAKKIEGIQPAPLPVADQQKESILAEAKKLVTAAWQSLSSQNHAKEEPELEIKNVNDLMKAHPELVAQITNQAGKDAVAAERVRITALDALDDGKNPTVTALVADAKATGKTADDIKNAVEIVKSTAPAPAPAAENKGEGWLKRLAADTTNSGVDNIGTDGAGGTADAQEEAQAVNFMADIINKKTGGKK